LLKAFLNHPKVLHIGQNYWYDTQYIWRDLLCRVKPFADTMVMQHTMFPGLEKSLAFQASLYAKVYKYWKEEGKTSKGKTDRERWVYNCKDCCLTFEVEAVLDMMLKANPVNIQAAYDFQLNRTLPALIAMMERGLLTQDNIKRELYTELTGIMAEIKSELNYILGEEFNPNSSDQKKALFYDLFELPVQYDPKTKKPTTGAEALETLKEKSPIIKPIADRIAEFGNLKTFSSTFLAAKLDIDGRMRCSYNLCGTDTFRLSSSQNAFNSGLNLQNVPKGGTTATGRELPNVRSLFIPDPDMTFFDIDLASADARIVAWEAQCPELMEFMLSGQDLYLCLAQEYFHDKTLTKKSTKRQQFKGVVHGTNYLGSAAGLAIRFGLLVHEVEVIQRYYFGRFPEVKAALEELKKQVMKRGWIENIFGYRRYFFNKQEPTLMQIAAAWKPQSTVGLIINRGMVAIHENEPDIQLLLQVHDSLAGQYPTNMPELKQRIITRCEIELPYAIPLTIPVEIKTSTVSWGECG
jgi:DNA polymerase-1